MEREDTRELWMEPGTARKRLRVSLGEYKGHRYLDLRRYFKDKEDGAYKPSKEGITLNKQRLLDLRALFVDQAERINDWLSVGYVPDAVDEEKGRQQGAANKVISGWVGEELRSVVKSDVHDTRIFRTETEGGKTTVMLNGSHPFYEEFNRLAPPGTETHKLIIALLGTYARASERADPEDSVRTFITGEWSSSLKAYLKRAAPDGRDDDPSGAP